MIACILEQDPRVTKKQDKASCFVQIINILFDFLCDWISVFRQHVSSFRDDRFGDGGTSWKSASQFVFTSEIGTPKQPLSPLCLFVACGTCLEAGRVHRYRRPGGADLELSLASPISSLSAGGAWVQLLILGPGGGRIPGTQPSMDGGKEQIRPLRSLFLQLQVTNCCRIFLLTVSPPLT